MNAENFADFLNDKSNLYKLSYQELKTLALQYPYSSNLQLLLTLKSKMEQHKDFESNLAKAATLCPDRTYLLQRIEAIEVNALQSDNLILKEDYLELKDLSQLEELDKIPVEPSAEVEKNGKSEIPDTIKAQLQHDSEQDQIANNNPFLNSSGKDYEDISLSEALLNELSIEENPSEKELQEHKSTEHLSIPDPAPELQPELQPEPLTEFHSEPGPQPISTPLSLPLPNELVLNLAAMSKILEQKPSTASVDTDQIHGEPSQPEEAFRPKPSPKSSFTSWVQQFQPDHTKLRLAELMEAKKREELKRKKKLKAKKKKKKKHKKNKQRKVLIIAQQSIKENRDIATETLAELLTTQGQYEKAIRVYHRLSSMYPNQQTYFDDKVAQLQILLQAD